MQIVDANIVLRYLLNDTEDLAEEAAKILENKKVYVPTEVIAEIVYVLEKVYQAKNDEIADSLRELFNYGNIDVDDSRVVEEALSVYSSRKLDFVDTLLFAYKKVRNDEVYTFDKKLKKLLNE